MNGDTSRSYPRKVELGDDTFELRYMAQGDGAAVAAFADALPAHDLLFMRRDITQPRVISAWLRGIAEGSITTLLANCIRYVAERGYTTIQPRVESEDTWTQRCYDSAKGMLFADVKNSWFFGYHNRGGEQGRFLVFTEGVPAYHRIFSETARSGYEGFEIR